LHCFAKGQRPRAVFLENCDSIRLPLDAAGVGRGVGTNPECALKSIDRFLTSLPRIQVDISEPAEGALLEALGKTETLSAPYPDGQRRGSGDRLKPWMAGEYEEKEKREDVDAIGRRAAVGGRNKPGMCPRINR
jgi:hypothetical protein